jgi:hypothetical protein
MSAIPIHIQRRLDQKWASRLTLQVASNAPKNVGTKAAVSTIGRRAAKTKEKIRRVETAGPARDALIVDPLKRNAKPATIAKAP